MGVPEQRYIGWYGGFGAIYRIYSSPLDMPHAVSSFTHGTSFVSG